VVDRCEALSKDRSCAVAAPHKRSLLRESRAIARFWCDKLVELE
jgi:hypothetical protein